MKKGNEYIFNADVIRFLAIIGVVIIHTANSVFERPDFFGGISWWFAIILNSASRICIPLFIMLSGFLLLKKNEKFSKTFQRIIKRLFIPLVVWTSIIYVISNIKTASDIFTLDFVLRFFTGNVYYFYFLVILTGLYFISPVLSSLVKYEKIGFLKKVAIFSIATGVAETALQYLDKNCSGDNLFTRWVPFLGIYLFGYLIGTKKWVINRPKRVKWMYLLGFVVSIALNYIYYSEGSIKVLRTLPTGCMTHYSDYYLSINVAIMALTAFVFLINTNFKSLENSFLGKIIYKVSRASFGIYLVNLIVVNAGDTLLHLDVDSIRIPLWSYVIIKFAVVFVISYIFTIIIKKIPLLRKTIGED